MFRSDPGHRVIARYGLFNAEYPRPVPQPTTLVIDRTRVVRWKSVEVNYKFRPTAVQVLEALAALDRKTDGTRR